MWEGKGYDERSSSKFGLQITIHDVGGKMSEKYRLEKRKGGGGGALGD